MRSLIAGMLLTVMMGVGSSPTLVNAQSATAGAISLQEMPSTSNSISSADPKSERIISVDRAMELLCQAARDALRRAEEELAQCEDDSDFWTDPLFRDQFLSQCLHERGRIRDEWAQVVSMCGSRGALDQGASASIN